MILKEVHVGKETTPIHLDFARQRSYRLVEPFKLGSIVVDLDRQGAHRAFELQYLLLERPHILIFEDLHAGSQGILTLLKHGDVSENRILERRILIDESSHLIGQRGQVGLRIGNLRLQSGATLSHSIKIIAQADDLTFRSLKLDGDGLNDILQVIDVPHAPFYLDYQLTHEGLQIAEDCIQRSKLLIEQFGDRHLLLCIAGRQEEEER